MTQTLTVPALSVADTLDVGPGECVEFPTQGDALAALEGLQAADPSVVYRVRTWDSAWRGAGVAEGFRFRLTVGPAMVAIAAEDAAGHERTLNRQADADPLVSVDPETGEVREPLPSRVIRGWSAKSRSRMLRAFAEVDFAPMIAARGLLYRVTLTYPSEWLRWAPDAETCKGHLRAFRQRLERATGNDVRGLWKQEYQARGAPHFHLLVSGPLWVNGISFRQWVARSWSEIVTGGPLCEVAGCEHDECRHRRVGTRVDREPRALDPKRVATYFAKHGTGKAYQDEPPDAWEGSTGRVWGFWRLSKATAVQDVDVASYVVLRRTLRRWSRANRRRARGYGGGRLFGGWSLCRNGPRLAEQLVRAVHLAGDQEHERLAAAFGGRVLTPG